MGLNKPLDTGLTNCIWFHGKQVYTSLFIYKTQMIYLLVHVNDIIITGNFWFIRLNSSFTLKQLGKLDYFLGIEVKSMPDNSCSHSEYIYSRSSS